MATSTSPGSRRTRAIAWLEVLGLAVLAYVPLLLSSPGRVSADSKQYLYLDPGGFLERAPHLWDAHVAAGGVSHQHIGYLWPMGPWFWVMDVVGVPTWIAQRLWVGTLAMAAALGTRWMLRRLGLSRAGVLAGTLVYLLTPYQLAFSARTSVLLLPWAGLPWLLGLADRARRDGGWRDPAWMALIILTIGAVNASSLVLVGIGPAIWLLLSIDGRDAARRVVGVVSKVALLGGGVSLWWIAALRLEAAYGLPVLQVTENLETVARTSSPADVLRGLGNWYFYGRDRLGYSIDQAGYYLDDRITVWATVGLSALGLAAAMAVRWRHRARFAALVLAGVVLAVGAWPLDDPSPVAIGFREFGETSAGLALRNTARAVPVIVLGLAGLLAAAVSAWRPRPLRWGAGVLVGALALAGMRPVALEGMLSEHQERIDPVPTYWQEAAADLDADGTSTRVLEIPGSNFAAYRWGNAVDPLLPGLMDRGHVGREVLPLGSANSALLIDALDRRVHEGTLEPAALAPIARLLGAGDVVVRSDLEYERFETRNPRALWSLLTDGVVPGLEDPQTYGPRRRNVPAPGFAEYDEVELRQSGSDEPPPVATFGVEDPVPIVRTAPDDRPVLVAGDGDGLVDAAAAGLIDGRSLVLQANTASEATLRRLLEAGGDLVVTDTYRRRIQTWFYAIRDTRGPTERAGQTLADPTGYDFRIDPAPGAGDDERTVVEHVGGTATATLGGGAPRPEDRAAVAFDGDTRTAWRIGGSDPTGNRLRLQVPSGVDADELILVQPQDGPRDRVLTEVAIRVDGGDPVPVALTDESLTPEGQVVALGAGVVDEVEIELTGVSAPPFDPALANAVGFAEVKVGDVRVVERVRVPVPLLETAAESGGANALDVVLTRLRYEPGARGRQDQERTLERRVELQEDRQFGLSGTLRVNPQAPDDVLDALLATDLGAAGIRASSRLAGDLGSRASRAIDASPDTAWRSSFGPGPAETLALALPEATDLADLSVTVRRDEAHSTPGRIRVVADGVEVGVVDVPDGEGPATVTLPSPDAPVELFTLEFLDVRGRRAVAGDPNPAAFLPIAVTDLRGTGIPVAVDGTTVDDGCRDIVRIDGESTPVRAVGPVVDARRGLELEPCDGAVALGAGPHTISTELGVDVGLDVDRLVLSSDSSGGATAVAARGTDRSRSGTEVLDVDDGDGDSFAIELATDGEPFWLVLGHSDNRGFEVAIDGADVGPREVVDGYANGWLVTPDGPGSLDASITWTPQRLVWITLAVSAAFVALCAAVLVATRRRSRTSEPTADVSFASPASGVTTPTAAVGVLAVLVGGVAYLAASPAAAVVGAGAVVLGSLLPRVSWLWIAVAPGLVLLAERRDEPALVWIALALLLADVVVDRRRGVPDVRASSSAPPSTSAD